MEGAWVHSHAGAAFSTYSPAFYPHEQGCVSTPVQLQKMDGIQLCRMHAEAWPAGFTSAVGAGSCCALLRDVSLGDGAMSTGYKVPTVLPV